MSRRHLVAAALWGVLASTVLSGTAHADPAGPTDYRSEIVAITPDVAGVSVDVLGGDSFIELTSTRGTDVRVIGYQGEPYLWFRPDGTVLENHNAPSRTLNVDRYGTQETPRYADADATPDWHEVAHDHTWVWHDHRSHWMQSIRPAGKHPGDRIVESVIPITVDGEPVSVAVISTWLPEPSPLPLVAGTVIATATIGAAGVLFVKRRRWIALLVPVAVITTVAGVWQYVSLPSETGPRLVWWLSPVLATACSVGATVIWRSRRFVAIGLSLAAGVQLVIWSIEKRSGLTAAIIPTHAPGWFDRTILVAAFASGAGVCAIALVELFARTPGTKRVAATT